MKWRVRFSLKAARPSAPSRRHETWELHLPFDGITEDYVAVPVTGSEFDKVDEAVPLGFRVRFLMGFPPERDILRLDPAEPDTAAESG